MDSVADPHLKEKVQTMAWNFKGRLFVSQGLCPWDRTERNVFSAAKTCNSADGRINVFLLLGHFIREGTDKYIRRRVKLADYFDCINSPHHILIQQGPS